jgi:hypothetical protein
VRIRFQPLLELRNRLRETPGKRNLLCIIIVRTQPLAENLANAAVRRAVEQGRIIRCHGTLLRRAGAPVVRALGVSSVRFPARLMLAPQERSLNDAKPLWGLRVAQLSLGDVQHGARIRKYW